MDRGSLIRGPGERRKLHSGVSGGTPAANAFKSFSDQIWPVSAIYLSDYLLGLSDYLFFTMYIKKLS